VASHHKLKTKLKQKTNPFSTEKREETTEARKIHDSGFPPKKTNTNEGNDNSAERPKNPFKTNSSNI
jgi:hypothetical protein